MSEEDSFSFCKSDQTSSSASFTEEFFEKFDAFMFTGERSRTFDNGETGESNADDWIAGSHARNASRSSSAEGHVIVEFNPGVLLPRDSQPPGSSVASSSAYQEGNNAQTSKSFASPSQIAAIPLQQGKHEGALFGAGSVLSCSSAVLVQQGDDLSYDSSEVTQVTGFSKMKLDSDRGSSTTTADQLTESTTSSIGSLGSGFVRVSIGDISNVRQCKVCNHNNIEATLFCSVCDVTLSANPHLEMDAQIAINLQRKEEELATLRLLEREKKRHLLPQKSVVAQASFFRSEIQMAVQDWDGFRMVPCDNLEAQSMSFISRVLSNGDGWKVKIAFAFTPQDSNFTMLFERGGLRLVRPFGSEDIRMHISTSVGKAWDIYSYDCSFFPAITSFSPAARGWLVAVSLKVPVGDFDPLMQVNRLVDDESILPLASFDATKRQDESVLHLQHTLETVCADFFEISLGLNPNNQRPAASRKRKASTVNMGESPFVEPFSGLRLPPLSPITPRDFQEYFTPDPPQDLE